MAATMTLRALRMEEVEFEVAIEPEEEGVRGNAQASGDDAADRKLEEEITERLERGDQAAWCTVMVTARWNGFSGWASLGCVSLDESYTLDVVVDDHDMKEEALAHLNQQIAESAASIAPLCEGPSC